MSALSTLQQRADELRREFDCAFAAPLRFDDTQTIDLLAIRAGDQSCAIRLSEVYGLHAGRKVTRIPGAHAAMCGIAGFRGTILPVYDLPVLLGVAAVPAAPRWLVIAKTAAIALSFDGFEGQRRVSRDTVMPQTSGAVLRRYARDFVRAPSLTAPLLHLPALIAALDGTNTEAFSQPEL
jgi:purine-binding chemotaxis protein CheW